MAPTVGRSSPPSKPPALPAPDELVIVDDPAPDAFALPGLPGRIVVSTGMLDHLTDADRQAMLAHERAHLTGHHYAFLAATHLAAPPTLAAPNGRRGRLHGRTLGRRERRPPAATVDGSPGPSAKRPWPPRISLPAFRSRDSASWAGTRIHCAVPGPPARVAALLAAPLPRSIVPPLNLGLVLLVVTVCAVGASGLCAFAAAHDLHLLLKTAGAGDPRRTTPARHPSRTAHHGCGRCGPRPEIRSAAVAAVRGRVHHRLRRARRRRQPGRLHLEDAVTTPCSCSAACSPCTTALRCSSNPSSAPSPTSRRPPGAARRAGRFRRRLRRCSHSLATAGLAVGGPARSGRRGLRVLPGGLGAGRPPEPGGQTRAGVRLVRLLQKSSATRSARCSAASSCGPAACRCCSPCMTVFAAAVAVWAALVVPVGTAAAHADGRPCSTWPGGWPSGPSSRPTAALAAATAALSVGVGFLPVSGAAAGLGTRRHRRRRVRAGRHRRPRSAQGRSAPWTPDA